MENSIKPVSTETITKTFQTIQTYLKNDEWVKTQDEDLIDALRMTQDVIEAVSQQIFIFLDCFEQYGRALEQTMRIPAFDVPSDSKVSTEPTQTFSSVSLA